MEPLVSIILPVCNASTYLSNCLESLLGQKHQNIEIIAIDDNSKDNSASILRKYRQMDKRIKVSTNVKRYGLAITLNRALKKTKGEFVTFMNPHDINSIWRIKKQIEFLRKNPKVVAVGTQAAMINDKGKIIDKTVFPQDHEVIYKHFLQGLSVQFETLMINKRLIPRDLLYFAHNSYPYMYIETFVKLFRYGQFANLLQHLYYHRGKQISESKLTKTTQVTKTVTLLVRSMAMYDYRPSLTSIFSPLTKINLN